MFSHHNTFAPMRLMVRAELDLARLLDVELHDGMTQWAIAKASR
jgi:hypothetical protein